MRRKEGKVYSVCNEKTRKSHQFMKLQRIFFLSCYLFAGDFVDFL